MLDLQPQESGRFPLQGGKIISPYCKRNLNQASMWVFSVRHLKRNEDVEKKENI